MKRKVVALLSFLVAATSAVPADKFVFDVELTCNKPDRLKFQFNMQFLEVDSWFSGNDVITPQRHGAARPGKASLRVEGVQYGDEKGSGGYEPRMILYHDCTEYEKETTVELDVTPKCETEKGICHYTIHKDITDLTGSMSYQAKLEYS